MEILCTVRASLQLYMVQKIEVRWFLGVASQNEHRSSNSLASIPFFDIICSKAIILFIVQVSKDLKKIEQQGIEPLIVSPSGKQCILQKNDSDDLVNICLQSILAGTRWSDAKYRSVYDDFLLANKGQKRPETRLRYTAEPQDGWNQLLRTCQVPGGWGC